jgi:hypothetical protein
MLIGRVRQDEHGAGYSICRSVAYEMTTAGGPAKAVQKHKVELKVKPSRAIKLVHVSECRYIASKSFLPSFRLALSPGLRTRDTIKPLSVGGCSEVSVV